MPIFQRSEPLIVSRHTPIASTVEMVTRNLDEANSLFESEWGPHKTEVLDRSNRFEARLRFKRLSAIGLSSLWCSSAMHIKAPSTKPFFVLIMRLEGSSEYSIGKRTFTTSPDIGVLFQGSRPLEARTAKHWQVYGTRFGPEVLDRELSKMLDRPIGRSVEFDPQINFQIGAGLAVKRMLVRLYRETGFLTCGEHHASYANQLIGIPQLERSLIGLLLEGLRHNYTTVLHTPRDSAAAPFQIRLVEEFISANADQPLSLGDLATVAGVNNRTLQYSFRRHRGYSPMRFLRWVRLDRVREELRGRGRDMTVTDSAIHWGLLHFGRFAAEYRLRFGEYPSETLRRRDKLKN